MPSSPIGVDKLYYAIMTQDDIAEGVAYQAPKALEHVKEIGVNTSSSVEVDWADNKPAEAVENDGETTVSIQVKDLPLEIQAEILGKSYEGGKLVDKVGDSAPYVAIMYRRKKGNGKYRYVKLLKVKFTIPSETTRTKETNVSFQNATIEGKVVYRDYDGKWRYRSDEDDPSYAGDGATWFDEVESGDTNPPTVTVSPLDEATGVSVDTTIVWTFNEAIAPATVTPSNFFLMKDDGTQVAGSLSHDSQANTVTFTPGANLTALTDYTAICTTNVTDISGNHIAANEVTNFTTS